MDQCTHEVCAKYWKGIIKAYGQRPAGESAKVGRMKTAYVNRVTIIGSENSENRLVT